MIINRSTKVVSVIEADGSDEIIQGFEPVICLNVDAVFIRIGIIQSEDGLRKLVITECVKRRYCHKGTKSSVIHFWSPDHPEGYCKYANTTAQGDVFIGSRCSLYSFRRALGADDIRMVYQELESGRSQYERDDMARRAQEREANRKAKGDFEIIDGVLKKYWGKGIAEEIPDGVTTIGEFAFVDEKGWERMLLEDGIYEAPPLERLKIPDSVRRIETYALAYCKNLTELSIPDGVSFIGIRAFEGCEALKSVKLPGGLKELGEFAFFLCEKLKEISIPEGITRIEPGTFFACDMLQSVEIPNTVVSIGKEAFRNCGSLKRITIPEGVEEIGESAFQGCHRLEKVVIPESVKRIGQNAFKGCKIVLEGLSEEKVRSSR